MPEISLKNGDHRTVDYPDGSSFVGYFDGTRWCGDGTYTAPSGWQIEGRFSGPIATEGRFHVKKEYNIGPFPVRNFDTTPKSFHEEPVYQATITIDDLETTGTFKISNTCKPILGHGRNHYRTSNPDFKLETEFDEGVAIVGAEIKIERGGDGLKRRPYSFKGTISFINPTEIRCRGIRYYESTTEKGAFVLTKSLNWLSLNEVGIRIDTNSGIAVKGAFDHGTLTDPETTAVYEFPRYNTLRFKGRVDSNMNPLGGDLMNRKGTVVAKIVSGNVVQPLHWNSFVEAAVPIDSPQFSGNTTRIAKLIDGLKNDPSFDTLISEIQGFAYFTLATSDPTDRIQMQSLELMESLFQLNYKMELGCTEPLLPIAKLSKNTVRLPIRPQPANGETTRELRVLEGVTTTIGRGNALPAYGYGDFLGMGSTKGARAWVFEHEDGTKTDMVNLMIPMRGSTWGTWRTLLREVYIHRIFSQISVVPKLYGTFLHRTEPTQESDSEMIMNIFVEELGRVWPHIRPTKDTCNSKALWSVLLQTADLLSGIHEKGWFLGDFKLTNTLIDLPNGRSKPSPSARVRLTDFGLTTRSDASQYPKAFGLKLTSLGGTYWAPECLEIWKDLECEGRNIDLKAMDVFAWGVNAVSMVMGTDPGKYTNEHGQHAIYVDERKDYLRNRKPIPFTPSPQKSPIAEYLKEVETTLNAWPRTPFYNNLKQAVLSAIDPNPMNRITMAKIKALLATITPPDNFGVWPLFGRH